MQFVRIGRCCYILDLKTWNIVLGCLNAFVSFGMLTLLMAVVSTMVPIREVTQGGGGLNFRAAVNCIFTGALLFSILLLLKLLFDMYFVYGVVMEQPTIIRAYFIMWVVLFIVSFLLFCANIHKYSIISIVRDIFYMILIIAASLLCHHQHKMLSKKVED